jgi:MFS transporter, DHA1 family, inner membrane transport protein
VSRPVQLAIVCAYAFLALMGTGALPLVIGQYIGHLQLSVQGAGQLASLETIALAVGCLIAVVCGRSLVTVRALACVGSLLLTLANLACGWLEGGVPFAIARSLAGLGVGLLYSAGTIHIARWIRPDREFALYFGTAWVSGPVALILAPYAFHVFGFQGAYRAFGLASLLALVATKFYPTSANAPPSALGPRQAWHSHTIVGVGLVVIGLLINYCFNGGLWIYFDRIGASLSLDPTQTGSLMSTGMLIGLVGTLVAVVLGDRAGRVLPVLMGHAALIAGASILISFNSPAQFLIAAALLNVGVTLITPCCLSVLALVDNGGRLPVIGTFTLQIGYGFGPAVLGALVMADDFKLALVCARIAFVVTVIMFCVAFWLLRPHQLTPAGRLWNRSNEIDSVDVR